MKEFPGQRLPPATGPVDALEGEELDELGREAARSDRFGLPDEGKDLVELPFRHIGHDQGEVGEERRPRWLAGGELAGGIDKRRECVEDGVVQGMEGFV